MDRRSFLTALGSSAVWPLVAQAQQPALPVIGFLNSGSPRPFSNFVTAFNEGLAAESYVHGQNVWIDYRWAEGHYGDLEALAADMVRRNVSVIAATGGTVSAQAAVKATSTIPIVFVVGYDPEQLGLVSSLNRPGGNATGVTIFTTELAIKRLELLHELLPGFHAVALLVNRGGITTDIETETIKVAAQKLKLDLLVIEAARELDFDPAFESAVKQKVGAVLISADPFFTTRHTQIVALASRHGLPAMYPLSAYVEAGGLVSYGTELMWAYRQVGSYAGRILKGAKPQELPVMQPTNFDLVINLKAAKTLGLNVDPRVLLRATKVLE